MYGYRSLDASCQHVLIVVNEECGTVNHVWVDGLRIRQTHFYRPIAQSYLDPVTFPLIASKMDDSYTYKL